MSPTTTSPKTARQASGTRAGRHSATDRRRQAAGQKAAATRRANANRRSAAARRAAATRQLNQRTTVRQAQDLAGKAVLIPVGAALLARDNVLETITDATKPYRSRKSAQRTIERDLKRFERRGSAARNGVERRVKRTRTRVERELRQRVSRVDEAVSAGQKAVAGVQERVASVA